MASVKFTGGCFLNDDGNFVVLYSVLISVSANQQIRQGEYIPLQ